MAVVGFVCAGARDREAVAREIEVLRDAGVDLLVVEQGEQIEGRAPLSAALTSSLLPGDTLIVVGLDQITSSVPALLEAIAELDRSGMRLRSLTEPVIDTCEEHGASVVAFAALLRRLDLGRTDGRSAVSQVDVVPQRARSGRPSVMSPERLAAAIALRDGGQSLSGIADALGVSASTVARALARHDDGGRVSRLEMSVKMRPGAALT